MNHKKHQQRRRARARKKIESLDGEVLALAGRVHALRRELDAVRSVRVNVPLESLVAMVDRRFSDEIARRLYVQGDMPRLARYQERGFRLPHPFFPEGAKGRMAIEEDARMASKVVRVELPRLSWSFVVGQEAWEAMLLEEAGRLQA